MLGLIALITFFATANQQFIENVISKKGVNQPWLTWVSVGLGVVEAVLFRIDAIKFVAETSGFTYVQLFPGAGSIFTGLFMGFLATLLHDLLGKVGSPAVAVKDSSLTVEAPSTVVTDSAVKEDEPIQDLIDKLK